MSGLKLLPITSTVTLQRCANLPNHDAMKTLFIASYPKSGTTWMQAIVFHLLNEGKGLPIEHISDYTPFYEIDKTWENFDYYSRNHSKLGWRVFNTHLLHHMLPTTPSMRYIYVVRNGRDVAVSFYHHLTNQVGAAGCLDQSFSEFLDDWCDGKIVFGSWLDHLNNWVESSHEDSSRVLLVHYEDMKTDLKASLRRISEFLQVDLSQDRIEHLASLLDFDGMKRAKELYQPISVEWKPGFEFLRKGEIGDSSSLFGPNEEVVFQAMLARRFPSQCPLTDGSTGSSEMSYLNETLVAHSPSPSIPDWLSQLRVL